MLSFALYLIGCIVCIAGVAWIATLLGAASMYVNAVAVVLFGIALFAVIARHRAMQRQST